ncbi:hypothetical protein RJ639_009134 [Escallonia herrerae]|uniref:Retroviral polymerase SH3-like domain-containing protein n=1 Tax=Escallonia herrerae TaxID=1293975 RepID=A0AA89AUK9_9ASTE|nr:hypothetical protein RJ639_009134 [Escallonia herrerae]
MAEECKGKIEKFNGMNFQWWKMQVEDYLYQKDLYLPLVGEKPEAMNANEWAILDRKALATIRLSLTPQDVRHIPELQKNLISISGLDCEGYYVAFGENTGRSTTSALNCGIPEEEWSGKLVNYSFLRVFGCIAYDHIDKEERKKLDSKPQKCVFIGYGGDEYGYRLWDYEHNKIIKSRDVIFDESRLDKHRLQEHGIEKENKEYMELDEPEDGQVPRTENPEVLDETTNIEIGAGDQQQVPETLNLKRSNRTKHIQLRYHFIWSLLEDGQLNLEKIEGNKNPTDMLVDRQKLSLCSTLISLH